VPEHQPESHVNGRQLGDAVCLGTEMLDGNRLFLRTAKTGCPVYCALPDFVAEALRTLPRLSERIRNLLFVRLEPASEVDLGKDLH
jgi:hypothetical protein